MDRIVAALLAGLLIGFGAYVVGVLLVLMAHVVPIELLGILIGVGFVLSILYDVATAQPSEPRRDGE